MWVVLLVLTRHRVARMDCMALSGNLLLLIQLLLLLRLLHLMRTGHRCRMVLLLWWWTLGCRLLRWPRVISWPGGGSRLVGRRHNALLLGHSNRRGRLRSPVHGGEARGRRRGPRHPRSVSTRTSDHHLTRRSSFSLVEVNQAIKA